MTSLFLVPHGITDWNLQHRYQGQTDIALCEAGRIQAACLARRMAKCRVVAVFASDLGRAWETASLIAVPHGLPVNAEPRLRELDFGQWEGKTYSEIERTAGKLLLAWEREGMEGKPLGGESLAGLASRVGAFIEETIRPLAMGPDLQDKAVVLVAHRGSLRVLMCLALGLSPTMHWKFQLTPASISQLVLLPDGGAVLTELNDTHHLAEVNHAG